MTEELIQATTLGDLLLRAERRWPEREAIVFPERRLSYAALAEQARVKARALQGLGVEPGDHVGVLATNLPEVAELLFALGLSGAVAVLINARYKAAELAYVVENADLKALFTTSRVAEHVDFVELLKRALPGLQQSTGRAALALADAPKLRHVVMMEAGPPNGMMAHDDFMAQAGRISAEAADARRQAVTLSAPCLMMYTSGTTSHPKGCRLSHEAVVRNALEISRRLELTATDRLWDPLPMFHMSAIMPLLALTWTGGCFISDGHFDADRALETLQAEDVSFLFTAFPAIMAAIVDHPEFAAERLPRLRMVNNVAPAEQLRRNMAALPQAVHISAYGMTEAAGISCFGSSDEDDDTRATCCGRPLPGVQLRVVDPESHEPLPAGSQGEMCIRGYPLFEGYYRAPDKTAESFDAEGWFHTGDLCVIHSSGQVSYHGRIKDMLKVGGENVAALEIEAYLLRHPDVVMAQVVGLPDDRFDEVPVAFIELRPGASVGERDIVEFCQGQIASFKVPRLVRFVTDWPMSATKVQKHRLREQLLAEFG